MASKFQSRLVGTIILVAAGVIILPDILDGEKKHFKEELSSIPIKPDIEIEVESFEVLEPIVVETTLPDSPVEVVSTETEEDKLDVSLVSTPSKNGYKDSAWIIQLMALKNADNAKKLVADLQKRGYQAHTKKESAFTRVIVGPDTSKSKLEKQIKELEKITGSKGQLMKFKPLNP